MKDQNKTRFEVGMPVMLIDNGEWVYVVIDSVNIESNVIFANSTYSRGYNFDLKGYCYSSDTNCSIAFTLPEYEALKALTDSFVDGTFGKEQKEFDYPAEVTNKLLDQFYTDAEKNAQPTPETTDLLDENGQPVYFEIGQKVGCLSYGKGKIKDKNNKGDLFINFSEIDAWYTFDGKKYTGIKQTLYPIEQYNQIQLPKLKPIHVAKQKEDVISLPSWFKGGAKIPSFDYYHGLGDIAWDKIKSFIGLLGAESLKDFTIFSWQKRVLCNCDYFNALLTDFIYKDKYYTMIIDLEHPDSPKTELLAAYNKNGKDISEKLC